MARAGQQTAQVRVAHLSPDASYVDIYAVSLNRDQVFPNVFYRAVSAYWGVVAGRFTYEVRPAGTDPTAPAAVSLTGRLQPGGHYSVAVVGPKANLRGVLLRDDLSPLTRGKARVRFVDSLLDRRPVEVVAGGKLLAKGLRLGAAGRYAELAPGRYPVQVRRAGDGRMLYRGALTLQAGTVTTAILTGGAGQPNELLPVRDGAGVRTMPATSGGVATGAGGTAAPAPARARPWPGSLPIPLAVAGMAAVALVPGRSRRRGRARARGATGSVAGRAVAGQAVAMLLAVPLLAGCAASPDASPPSAPAGAPAAQSGSPRSMPAGAPGTPALQTPERAAAAAVPRSRPALERSALPSQVLLPGPPSPPVALSIPAIGVRTRLARLGLDSGGSMEVPAEFGQAGWYTGGPAPGEQGPAVIAGHVDSRSGPAVFFRLRELKAGDVVGVRRADGVTLRFTVERARQYPKADFPRDMVFGTVSEQALRLVTCGGSFDHQRHSYRDNLVVDARLTGFSPA
jgi:Domain of unknown function (DUF4397)/Sortase domain